MCCYLPSNMLLSLNWFHTTRKSGLQEVKDFWNWLWAGTVLKHHSRMVLLVLLPTISLQVFWWSGRFLMTVPLMHPQFILYLLGTTGMPKEHSTWCWQCVIAACRGIDVAFLCMTGWSYSLFYHMWLDDVELDGVSIVWRSNHDML